MKRGFTLIELLLVVGIMAMLGTAATGGYAALQRGMAERGSVATVNALLKSAKERARIDRVPTMVFCYNRLIREADADNNAIVVGEAVAVRRAGRISFIRSNLLFDEFSDLGKTYDVEDEKDRLEERRGMRLWYFPDKKMSQMSYSIVADAVYEDEIQSWSFAGASNLQIRAYAFYDKKQDHGSPQWTHGSGYGFEFATIQLPHNFIFSSGGVPTDLKTVTETGCLYFDPENTSDQNIDIYVCRPDASGKPSPNHKAGTASSKENATS